MRSSRISLTFALLAVALLATQGATAQQSKRVLFVGNSYTEVNNLPAMVQQVAASMGDTLVYQSNTPGGCTFSQHCTNASMTYINQGGWDAVVLQEQSQYPSFPQEQVENEVFPYARQLVEAVYASSPCAEPMFYMTWGRRDGDAGNAPYFPVLATYEGMDSMLYERYTYMAAEFDASVCPVGRVWRSLRRNNPSINLYASDGSHPSVEGTYAAAVAFYVMLFGKDPTNVMAPASVVDPTASIIRQTVKEVVYDSLVRWQRVRPQADFTVSTSGGHIDIVCGNNSQHADSYVWYFGDDSEPDSTADSLVYHQYSVGDCTYNITLVASRHCMTDTMTQSFYIPSTGAIADVREQSVVVSPNPSHGSVTISSRQHITALTLYDAQGRMILRRKGDGAASLVVEALAPGIYHAWVQTSSATVTRRVVVF